MTRNPRQLIEDTNVFILKLFPCSFNSFKQMTSSFLCLFKFKCGYFSLEQRIFEMCWFNFLIQKNHSTHRSFQTHLIIFWAALPLFFRNGGRTGSLFPNIFKFFKILHMNFSTWNRSLNPFISKMHIVLNGWS